MPKRWDRGLKQLFRKAPEDIVKWLFPEAEYVQSLPTELDAEPVFADQLCEMQLDGERVLLHLEFQRNHDLAMAKRLWSYNVRATLQYDCSVWSCVIYLKKVTTPEQEYYRRELSNGRSIHHFDFSIVRLWEIPTDELWEKRLPGLLPLLVLTKDGAKREVVEGIITELVPSPAGNKADLLALTYGLASLVFERADDQNWLIGRFAMLDDILMETPAFQELRKKAEEKGMEKGREEGLREAVVFLVQDHFENPALTRLVQERISHIDNIATLHKLLIKVGSIQMAEDVEKLFVNGGDAGK